MQTMQARQRPRSLGFVTELRLRLGPRPVGLQTPCRPGDHATPSCLCGSKGAPGTASWGGEAGVFKEGQSPRAPAFLPYPSVHPSWKAELMLDTEQPFVNIR